MATEASRNKILWWGATLRCARCGSGGVFRGWKLKDACPKCGLHFEREHGYWTGALAIHFVLVGGIVLVSLFTLVLLTVPKVPVTPLIIVLLAECLLFGFFLYPLSKTLWVAIDRAFMQRMDADEARDERFGN